MEVILLERIEKLGTIGDVVKVKNGYARNFLLPRGKALRANDSNRKVFEANREKIEATNAERRGAAETESKKVDGAKVQLIRQASNTGQLYGSVSARDLAEALEAAGHKIAKNQIVLDRPIKAIGVQEVKIALHPEVSVTISVNIARSPEEAELQAQGKDVMAEMFEKDVAGFIEERDSTLEPGEIAPEAAAEEEVGEEPGPAEEAAAEAPAEEASEEAPAEAAEPAEGDSAEDSESADKA
jgi:large subunit ribosomal protein L9